MSDEVTTIDIRQGFLRSRSIPVLVAALYRRCRRWFFHERGKVGWAGEVVELDALESSTYMKLGPIMKSFTGNIGHHRVHHLNPHIPVYVSSEATAILEGQFVQLFSNLGDVHHTWPR